MRRVLPLFAVLSLAFAPVPFPKAKPTIRPIEAAFEKIRLGMTKEEVFNLMASFREVETRHAQWPCWTDGQFEVLLTVWPDGDVMEGILASRPHKVQDKALYKKVSDGLGPDWVPVR